MSRDDLDREFHAVARLILGDAVARDALRADGRAVKCTYSTVLAERVPVRVTLSSFIPPRPAGDLPPEAYLHFILWPDEPRRQPMGYFNVAFLIDRGWMLCTDKEYRSDAHRSAELTGLIRGVRP